MKILFQMMSAVCLSCNSNSELYAHFAALEVNKD